MNIKTTPFFFALDVERVWFNHPVQNPQMGMNTEQSKLSVGKMVMSRDAGHKLIRSVTKPHGPYRLIKITKAGLAVLEGREEFRIPLSLLEAFEGIER